MSSNPIVVFFHGLNTFGDDLLHLGPVTLGRMDLHLQSAFESRGFSFISIDGLGLGSPEAQADLALQQLSKKILTIPGFTPGTAVHLLGQSMGGLVARVVAHRLSTDLKSNPSNLLVKNIISIGTPHRGTLAANFAVDFTEKNPTLARLLASVGYDVAENSETFRHYSPQSLDTFNLKYPIGNASAEHAFICAVPLRLVSRYFLGFYPRLHGVGRLEMIRGLLTSSDVFAPSDGFIPIGSQNWGRAHGPYRLDHFGQMGYFSIVASRQERVAARQEFGRLCDDVATVVR